MSAGMKSRPQDQPDWMATLRAGDVLKGDGGILRIVRKLTRNSNGALWGVTFAIRRRSWTNRAYTVVTANDLRQRGYRPVAVRVTTLRGSLNRRIQQAIDQPAWEKPYAATAADAIGMP